MKMYLDRYVPIDYLIYIYQINILYTTIKYGHDLTKKLIIIFSIKTNQTLSSFNFRWSEIVVLF